ncbi:MAG: MFS transporter [Aquificota bacterium]|nr:MFS transporter [Aquificota bacterium]
MIRKVSFALFDTGETILGALVFSTFFPLYITEHVDPKVYSFLYGLSFLASFGIALYLGKIADTKALRKSFFVSFGVAVPLLCWGVGLAYSSPILSLIVFLALAVSHQQAFVFYNSMLLGFESRGLTSGIGVTFGYVGSALSLIFLAKILSEPEVYFITGSLFLVLSLPAYISLRNPHLKKEVKLGDVLKDRRFLLLILSILAVTEVANTLIAMMGVYLREVYSLNREDIYRVIGLSALGGVLGGVLWGYLSDRLGVGKVFPAGFFLWFTFLAVLPGVPESLLLPAGLLAGVSLSHIWTTSRVLILSEFPEGEASVRLSFLSLTERVASTTGLILWSLLLALTGDNYRASAFLMSFLPLLGFFLFLFYLKAKEKDPAP